MPDYDNSKTEKLLAGLIGWALGYVFGLLYVVNVLEPLSDGTLMK